MADVKWIKIVTDIFDDEKILLIDGIPEHDAIIVIWFKLLCLAGKQNNGGVFMINDKIAFTDEMLATIFHRPLNTVRLALSVFCEYGMIEIIDNTITIPNWGKHQNLESIDQARKAVRKRVQKYREKQKQLAQGNAECNAECNVTVTLRNADRIREEQEDRDKDKDEDEDEDEEDTSLSASQAETSCPFEKIKRLYHEICVSYPKIKTIDGNRRKAVAARWRMYNSLDTFTELFRIAEASPFLKGKNDRSWSADFDWMMKPSNFSKILEHKYSNRAPNRFRSFDADEFFRVSLTRSDAEAAEIGKEVRDENSEKPAPEGSA